MIFVDGAPISSSSSSSRGFGTLVSLLQHPKLVSASNSFKAFPERKVSFAEDLGSRSSMQKHVYVFQREYATVDPTVVEFVGTDEATTCVGLVIRNPKTGMTSVAHMDSPAIVDLGVNQMLLFVIDQNSDAELDVHLIGGFDDASPKCNNGMNGSESYSGSDGHSFPLCSRIVEALERRREKCHIQTLCVLDHNTRRDSGGIAFPIVNGFLVETCSGSIMPATFDRTSRCPDEIVRRIRVIVSFEDPTWKGKLLETYDTCNDRFQIAACSCELLREEERLLTQTTLEQEKMTTAHMAFSAHGKGKVRDRSKVQCFSCKNYGHIAANCTQKLCNYCKKQGHIVKDCSIRPQNRQTTAFQATVGNSSTDQIQTGPSTMSAVNQNTQPTVLTPEMVQQMIVSAFSALGLQGSGIRDGDRERA